MSGAPASRSTNCAGKGCRRHLAVALACVGALLGTKLNADFYFGAAVGGDRLPSMRLVSGDDDRASRCDEYINPRYAELPACTAPDRSVGAADAWSSRFASAWGAQSGVAVGYRLGERYRIELEADYGSVGLDTSSPIIAPSGIPYDTVAAPELADAYERIGNAKFLGLFVTAYVDLPNPSRFTPFIGIGTGVGFASMDYDVLWERTDNLDNIVYAGAGLPNEDEIRRNLVGGDTRARQRLRDRLGAAHVTLGIGYALTERMSLEIRARHVRSSAFGDGGSYITLRGHPSGLRRDGSEPVRWHVGTEDTSRTHVGLRLNYRL
ncbi:MAG: porin family protein [Gammaproteobacteria bacterium]|nr:porin family protein [Gammaproteobacteria bacterium]